MKNSLRKTAGVFAVLIALGMMSCGQHVHTFSDEWSKNEEAH